MVNFGVPDLDAILGSLRAEGPTSPRKRGTWKASVGAAVTDPEGNRIEFWQPPGSASFWR
jgi:predicted enzyme related to lactoylglutathione lyase